MPHLKVFITRTITDTKTGKIIKKYRKRECKSFVKAFMQWLEAMMAHPYAITSDNVTIKDTGGTDRSCHCNTSGINLFACESPAGNITYGIVVGTGTTAPTVTDNTIETPITEGAIAGKMNYAGTSIASASVSGDKMLMAISRVIVNNSGGTITVKEVCFGCESGTAWFFLFMRDAVDDAVNNGQTYTVTYTYETSV